jgi:hypothetical protein
MVSHQSPLLARGGRRLGSEDGSYISDLSFGLPPFGRVPGFGLRISKQVEGRDFLVEEAFSRDLN